VRSIALHDEQSRCRGTVLPKGQPPDWFVLCGGRFIPHVGARGRHGGSCDPVELPKSREISLTDVTCCTPPRELADALLLSARPPRLAREAKPAGEAT
jgi:hypothetical protein